MDSHINDVFDGIIYAGGNLTPDEIVKLVVDNPGKQVVISDGMTYEKLRECADKMLSDDVVASHVVFGIGGSNSQLASKNKSHLPSFKTYLPPPINSDGTVPEEYASLYNQGALPLQFREFGLKGKHRIWLDIPNPIPESVKDISQWQLHDFGPRGISHEVATEDHTIQEGLKDILESAKVDVTEADLVGYEAAYAESVTISIKEKLDNGEYTPEDLTEEESGTNLTNSTHTEK